MDLNTKINDICDLQKTLITALKSVFAEGCANADTKEVGEATDILKDLTEAEKNLREAKYYELINEAMEEEQKFPEENMRRGYNKTMTQKPYIDAYMNRSNSHMVEDMDDWDRRGYNAGMNDIGMSYDDYKSAKRNYTETRSIQDKDEMEHNAKKHFDKAVSTIKEIWGDTPVAHKSRMKDELTALAESLPIL